ncbi:hypothetical protein AWB92_21525 [Mycobacterium sp. IEC1808]|uniref:Uncharacterized protein n=1 Tax=Mycobacterium paraense TaxID=767916 RepID=A0A1X2AJA3_9MYCO|nr:hypothetical protein AWB90_04775 [Mycobacterium paraense]ORW89202.1 hypothetical protein AWB92_21525 [Mycobacterium sp. IEC1808]
MQYMEQTLAISQNMIVILDQITKNSNALDEDTANFLSQILGLVEAGERSAVAVKEFQQSVRGVYGMSRAVRRPLQIINEGAQSYLDAQSLLDDWKRRIQDVFGFQPRSEDTTDN